MPDGGKREERSLVSCSKGPTRPDPPSYSLASLLQTDEKVAHVLEDRIPHEVFIILLIHIHNHIQTHLEDMTLELSSVFSVSCRPLRCVPWRLDPALEDGLVSSSSQLSCSMEGRRLWEPRLAGGRSIPLSLQNNKRGEEKMRSAN